MTSQKTIAKQKVSGVILIDKPQGMTSQQVVSKVKYLFQSPEHNSKKAGHTGTLDPMATGLLPICLGEATKFSHYQLDADKSYQATILLGSQTDTGDADGQVIAQAEIPELNAELLNRLAQQFLGAQQQIPPMYSALKKDGKKLYEYARAGIEIDRPARDIVIKALTLTQIDAEKIDLVATCSKGTYVRVLGEDIAKALGTLGHLTALRRLQVGKFDSGQAIDIPSLEALPLSNRFGRLLPVDACVDIAAKISLDDEQCQRLRLGQRLNVIEQIDETLRGYILQKLSKDSQGKSKDEPASHNNEQTPEYELPVDIKLMDEQRRFIGLGTISLNGRLQPKKIIHL
ncbi:tRNA pseudouridine(55) synthase TruB [Psychrobacter sp. 2Y5]|uniref:tRNA pseudouridine(55) synthase TruB n=1 Tax=unclassified Psychrobacter TaxID=196806 RepID=UPI003F45F4C1